MSAGVFVSRKQRFGFFCCYIYLTNGADLGFVVKTFCHCYCTPKHSLPFLFVELPFKRLAMRGSGLAVKSDNFNIPSQSVLNCTDVIFLLLRCGVVYLIIHRVPNVVGEIRYVNGGS